MTGYLQAQYNLEDQAFVSIIDDLSLWSAPFGLKLLDTIRYKKYIRALDIGFGSGFPLVELAMRLGSSSTVYGIDPGKAGIERTRLKLRLADVNNVELVQGVAEKMPFANDFFDLIVSNNGLNNVQSLTGALAECNRVSKIGAQLVFTFNTDNTFIEFYDLYREVLRENGLQEYENVMNAHIYEKRRPLPEFKGALQASGFQINSINEDEFSYRFSDGSSMLNHFFMKLAFMGAWKKIIPEEFRSKVFKHIEEKMNCAAEKSQGFLMRVPFVTINCEKSKQLN